MNSVFFLRETKFQLQSLKIFKINNTIIINFWSEKSKENSYQSKNILKIYEIFIKCVNYNERHQFVYGAQNIFLNFEKPKTLEHHRWAIVIPQV